MKALKRIWSELWLPILIIVLIAIFYEKILVSFPKWITNVYYENFNDGKLNPMVTGPIGDTFGGMVGPLIALFAAFLTFLAFWVQFKANVEQKKDLQIERFENKFYELLRFHKDNISEIKIDGNEGMVEKRKAFVSMYNEFRYSFWCCKDKYNQLKDRGELHDTYSDEQLVRLAYIFFLGGVGDNSDMVSRAINKNPNYKFEDKLFNAVLAYFKLVKSKTIRPCYFDYDGNPVILRTRYLPWGGHQSRLGHYYRHLFQTVKYVDKQDEDLITLEDKVDYLRMLRAQLSDYEQVLLYYNAISHFGEGWLKNNYFIKYKMIHNIPLPLASFGITPQEKFKDELEKDSSLFEWSER
jgi:Putative phage abortive infection protein